MVAGILVEAGLVSEADVRYARRVREKLAAKTPLIDVLVELGHVTHEQVRAALRERRLDIRIGELLVELGHLDEEDLRTALDIQAAEPDAKVRLGEVLTAHHFIDQAKLVEVLSYQLGLAFAEPQFSEIEESLLSRASLDWYQENQLIPVAAKGEKVTVAFADPMNAEHMAAAERAFGKGKVVPAIAQASAIEEAIGAARIRETGELRKGNSDLAAVEIVDQLLDVALEGAATEVHIEPLADRVRIRFRRSGLLCPHREYPLALAEPIADRIKVMSRMAVGGSSGHRTGQFGFAHDGRLLDLRVSILETVTGERIQVALPGAASEPVPLDLLDVSPRVLQSLREDLLERPGGFMLISGAAASGKTTTFHACLDHLRSAETAIISIEEGASARVEGVGHCSHGRPGDPELGDTLRHAAAQNVDVIGIGELDEGEPVREAVAATLSGCKVLSTLRARDGVAALARLLSMGVAAGTISSALTGVFSQALLRRVCETCAEDYEVTPGDLRRLACERGDLGDVRFRVGRGCDDCQHSGYRGRLGVFELLVMNERLRDAIRMEMNPDDLRDLARASGPFVSLREAGLVRAAEGQTSIAEILRVIAASGRPRPLAELRRLAGE